MFEQRSKMLDFFFKFSLALLITITLAIALWMVALGGTKWLSYWVSQILK
ncbi:MAG TPA: hypothetical protein PLX04_01185 [Caldisericia bacterium]|nr:hypothetical protein [Caldisericia bacterium]HOR47646.1 hypothetical protein [Caldisericia bacterium]HOU07817.1 hypothetical protein [Caldisericia bacterium]HPL88862.1 hypothetical protein [Caldisericia bacterium]HQG59387.1 hypothetical protein [Caldisericia bacterium]